MRKSKKHPGRCGARNTLFVVGTPDTDSPQPVDQDSAADPQTETIYLAGGSMAKPAYQARSRQRHVDLIQAGLKLIQTRDFDDLPVSAIVAEAGCAVGSFYTRFEDKDAYFAALQLSVLDQIRDEAADWFAEQPWSSAPVAECIERLVGWLVHNFVRHRGVIRAGGRNGSLYCLS